MYTIWKFELLHGFHINPQVFDLLAEIGLPPCLRILAYSKATFYNMKINIQICGTTYIFIYWCISRNRRASFLRGTIDYLEGFMWITYQPCSGARAILITSG